MSKAVVNYKTDRAFTFCKVSFCLSTPTAAVGGGVGVAKKQVIDGEATGRLDVEVINFRENARLGYTVFIGKHGLSKKGC